MGLALALMRGMSPLAIASVTDMLLAAPVLSPQLTAQALGTLEVRKSRRPSVLLTLPTAPAPAT